jgi:ERCC4-related helicase
LYEGRGINITMTLIDNITTKLGDDLKKEISKVKKLKLCSAYFSIYAFQELKKELKTIKEFNFLFNSPTFLKENKLKKEEKKFYIPNFVRERTLAGGEFEIRLRNNLSQKAIAKECKKWIEEKGKFMSLAKQIETNVGFFLDDGKNSKAYINANSFTTDGLGYTKTEQPINVYYPKIEGKNALQFIEQFDQIWKDKNLVKDVTEEVINYISAVHKENSSEYLYFVTLYNIFNEFLEDINEDTLANEKTGFKETKIWNMLYNFQRDAVLGAINKIERHNGCVLADSVGLGKTFTALGVIKYYELRNKKVLVLCPKRLADNWNTFKSNYKTNMLVEDRFSYDVLYHTDLSRDRGISNSLDLSKINWGNYDLVVIDESHNFRNNEARQDRETRYQKLMRKVIREGVKTKVLMLSATPVNNRFLDLRNQLALAYEGDSERFSSNLGLKKSIEAIFNESQRSFNTWSKLKPLDRTARNLLDSLSFDFFEILDAVTIARSRKHILKYYDTSEIGKFPHKNKPINKNFELTDIKDFMSFKDIYTILGKLNLKTYTPSEFIFPEKKSKYEHYDTKLSNRGELKQSTRESGIMKLMRVNLLKRLESSVESFRLTLGRLNEKINDELKNIEKFKKGEIKELNLKDVLEVNEIDEDLEDDDLIIGRKIKINLADMDVISWERNLEEDKKLIEELLGELSKITPQRDSKLNELTKTIEEKINQPINSENKKILIFSAFADSVYYLYENLADYFKKKYNLNCACISGGAKTNKNTAKHIGSDMNEILTYFSPISKQKDSIYPNSEESIDILFATDCISEGQNLQDCDFLINYDIHWNPVRIIQRFGRIDRIGSKNGAIQLVNFWPPVALDEYIQLKDRVESRMHALNLTATGEENILVEENGDLEYRTQQLKRLQEEVVELEDMNTGVSITDLGLNDFRIDLVNYEDRDKLQNVPFGLHAIVKQNKGLSPGVIYVLRNVNQNINIDNMNRLHPFYLVYVGENGEIISNHLDVKQTLDSFRALCKNKPEPDFKLAEKFNKETKDGLKMDKYSGFLQNAIQSIISVKEEQDLNSLFKSGGTSINKEKVRGLSDFELICFLVIK